MRRLITNSEVIHGALEMFQSTMYYNKVAHNSFFLLSIHYHNDIERMLCMKQAIGMKEEIHQLNETITSLSNDVNALIASIENVQGARWMM